MRKRPPIEGLPPTERPRCAFCDRPMPIMSNDIREQRPGGSYFGPVIRRTFVRYIGYCWNKALDAPLFCRLRCAKDFAWASYEAGYRITRRGK